ncbi:MAG: hypothetical protein ACLSCV_00155 [Acutalibacteraceae bacterium]
MNLPLTRQIICCKQETEERQHSFKNCSDLSMKEITERRRTSVNQTVGFFITPQ